MTPPTAGHMLLLEELTRGHDGEPLPGPTKASAIARGYVAHALDGGLALTDAGREVLGPERVAMLAAQGRTLAGENGDAGTLELAVRRALSLAQSTWAASADGDLPGHQYRAIRSAGVLVDDDQDDAGASAAAAMVCTVETCPGCGHAVMAKLGAVLSGCGDHS